ncbi:MAG: YbbR-like domain-containing protein [Bacteroidia bacterium]|nr:YbbR-like domain-containing protein [Bacteroidia bacterium]
MNTNNSKYSSDKKKPGKAKAFFICLVLASFLWLVHSLNTVYTYNFKIPVVFKNIPQNKKPLADIPEKNSIDAKASGLKIAMILLKRPFKPLEIDFNTLKQANQNYVISASHLNFRDVLHFETQVKNISPDTLYFSVKSGFQKNVPVKVPFYLKCKEGYGYKKPVLNPSFVTVWGDTSVLKDIDTVYANALTLSDLNKNMDIQLDLVKSDPQLYLNNGKVQVFIEVAKLVEQTVTIPVYDLRKSLRNNIRIYPSNVKVRFTSVQNTFNEQDTSLFKAMVDSEKINPETKKSPVFLSTFPGHVTVMDIDPKEVEILIFKQR